MARAIILFLALGLGLGMGIGALYLLSGKFYGIWLPFAFGFGLYALLGMLPKLQKGRFAYSLMTLGGVLCCWFLTREKLFPERWDVVSRHAPQVALALAVFGAVMWIVIMVSEGKAVGAGPLLALAICACIIGYFSGGVGGASHMEGWFQRLFSLSQEDAHTVTVAVRKSIHFLFYGLVGVLALIAARRGGSANAVLFVLLWALANASFDEMRQGYAPGRGSSATDVLLDMAGAGTLVGVATALAGRRRGSTSPTARGRLDRRFR